MFLIYNFIFVEGDANAEMNTSRIMADLHLLSVQVSRPLFLSLALDSLMGSFELYVVIGTIIFFLVGIWTIVFIPE